MVHVSLRWFCTASVRVTVIVLKNFVPFSIGLHAWSLTFHINIQFVRYAMTKPIIRSLLVLAYLNIASSFVLVNNFAVNNKFETGLRVVPESTFDGERPPVSFNPHRTVEHAR